MNRIEEAKRTLEEHNLNGDLASYLYKYLPSGRDYEEAVKELIEGIPVQYIVGDVDFLGNIIKVNKNVLIPRFETELLVEETIKFVKDKFNHKIDVVDLGTGSGCIAISLKKELDCNMTAVDISLDALEVAKNNAKDNLVEINFLQGDMLNPLRRKYDVIISNPPYISYDEEIMDIVKNNEPSLALYADNKGLYYYEEILKNCRKYLKDKFLIAFEIGYLQKDEIVKMANMYLDNVKVVCKKDLSEKDRMIFITNIN